MTYKLKILNKLMLKRVINPVGCWNWIGPRQLNGYGLSSYQGKTTTVARIVMHICNDFDLDSPKEISHKCGNPACFNPTHLEVKE